MSVDPERVTVTQDACNACGIPAVQVSHRSYPELRVTDMTTEQAAEHLASRLAADLDAVSNPSRRKRAQRAIRDIEAFLERVRAQQPSRPR
jgi:hypothetical protein